MMKYPYAFGIMLWLALAHPSEAASDNPPLVSVTAPDPQAGRPVSLNMDFVNAPLAQALTQLFLKAGAHSILEPNLKGRVTLKAEDVPLDRALRYIQEATEDPQRSYRGKIFVYLLQGSVCRVNVAPDMTPFTPKPYESPEDKPLPVQTRKYGKSTLILLPHPKVAPSKASSAPLSWGVPAPSGLQMGLWKPANGTLLCVLRNAGSKPLRYCDYFLGSVVDLRVWVRPHGTLFWTQAHIIWPYQYIPGAGEGIGPNERDIHDLPPGQVIRKHLAYPSWADSYPKYYSPTWNDAFDVPLYAYDWPDSKTGVDIKVTQLWTLQDTDSVDSGVITLPLETVRGKDDFSPASAH